MKIGIIGPNKLYNLDSNEDERRLLLSKLAEIIAKSNNEIILTPDKDSLVQYFGEKYLEYGGNKIWLILPINEPGYEKYLCTDIGHVISCDNWDIQADEFNRQCDVFICVGYAWGAMKEIACAQYFNKKKIYIIEESISEKLPEELNFLVEYIPINKLENTLQNLFLS